MIPILEVFCEKGVLKNFAKFTRKPLETKRKLLVKKIFFSKVACLVFSCEFYTIFKNTFFYRTALVTASQICVFWLANPGLFSGVTGR